MKARLIMFGFFMVLIVVNYMAAGGELSWRLFAMVVGATLFAIGTLLYIRRKGTI